MSVCGGEPLIYPGSRSWSRSFVARRKHVYLCTNGLLLEKKLPGLRPSSRLMINVHLDGMEATHDRAAGREGVFQRAVAGITAAKRAGFLVCTNTTIYRETDMHEIAVLFEYLTELGVDGFMISPAYGYDAVRNERGARGQGSGVRVQEEEGARGWGLGTRDEGSGFGVQGSGVVEASLAPSPRPLAPSLAPSPQSLAPSPGDGLFMTREEVHAKFRQAEPLWARLKLVASPVYRQFLCGRRTLRCAAWANPTRNVRGWKGPCYLITDGHYATYRELVESTDWERLGHHPQDGRGGDPRCEHCLVHCGFEPAAVFAANHRLRDVLAMAVWQMT